MKKIITILLVFVMMFPLCVYADSQDILEIDEPEFVAKRNGKVTAFMNLAHSLEITIGAKATANAPEEGVRLAVLVALFEENKDEAENGKFLGLFAPDDRIVKLQPNESGTVKINVDLTEYTVIQKYDLYAKVIVWDSYSNMKPYVIPAKFDKVRGGWIK